MSQSSRVEKSILNARMNTICYFVSLLVAFFTRKVLLDNLGIEFIGLTGTLGSLLSFLNVAELGVSTAIGYILYKPLFENDQIKIGEIVSVLGYLYRYIGFFILCSGFILSIFLPFIFSNTEISLGVIYFGFYSYLATASIGYFVNYRMILLAADQRNYIITGYFQASISAKVVLQMILAVYTGSFYAYFVLEILFSLVNAYVLQKKIRATYPWLQSNVKEGHNLYKNYPAIKRYIKQIFVHKMASFVQFQLSPILIYAYVSLPMVALYSNYTIVTQRVQSLFLGVMGSTWAGVGNLISEGDKRKVFQVYKGLLAVNIFMGSIITVSVYILITPFIQIWLGPKYELPSLIVLLISIQLFLQTVRGINDQFINGFGIFYDTWAPIAESVLFLVFSIVMGSFFGLPGVLSGPLISTVLIVYGWKPFFLFRKGFELSIFTFIRIFIIDLLAAAISASIAIIIYKYLTGFYNLNSGWLNWIEQAILFSCLLGLISFILFNVISSDFRNFCKEYYIKKVRHG